jgi:uncharacterized membrane protein YkoI
MIFSKNRNGGLPPWAGFDILGAMESLSRIVLMSFALAVLTVPVALAQEDVIKIINEDGTVTVFDPWKEQREKAAEKAKQEAAQRAAEEEAKRAAGTFTAPKSAITDSVSKPAAKKKAAAAYVSPERWSKPYPPRKPPPPGQYTRTRVTVPSDGPVTKEMAKMIALKHAPPARTMRVIRRTVNDKPVYAVVFYGESGETHEVIIDMASGDIIQ